jgi:hypothetical protein
MRRWVVLSGFAAVLLSGCVDDETICTAINVCAVQVQWVDGDGVPIRDANVGLGVTIGDAPEVHCSGCCGLETEGLHVVRRLDTGEEVIRVEITKNECHSNTRSFDLTL